MPRTGFSLSLSLAFLSLLLCPTSTTQLSAALLLPPPTHLLYCTLSLRHAHTLSSHHCSRLCSLAASLSHAPPPSPSLELSEALPFSSFAVCFTPPPHTIFSSHLSHGGNGEPAATGLWAYRCRISHTSAHMRSSWVSTFATRCALRYTQTTECCTRSLSLQLSFPVHGSHHVTCTLVTQATSATTTMVLGIP